MLAGSRSGRFEEGRGDAEREGSWSGDDGFRCVAYIMLVILQSYLLHRRSSAIDTCRTERMTNLWRDPLERIRSANALEQSRRVCFGCIAYVDLMQLE